MKIGLALLIMEQHSIKMEMTGPFQAPLKKLVTAQVIILM